jgi:Globin
MTPQQVALVQESFEKIAAMGEPAWQGFYAELFAIEPSLKQMFKGDIGEQRKKLLAALALVMRALHAPATILDPLKSLAVKHVGYGVKPEHYTYMGHGAAAHAQQRPRRRFYPGAAYGLGGGVPDPGDNHEGSRLQPKPNKNQGRRLTESTAQPPSAFEMPLPGSCFPAAYARRHRLLARTVDIQTGLELEGQFNGAGHGFGVGFRHQQISRDVPLHRQKPLDRNGLDISPSIVAGVQRHPVDAIPDGARQALGPRWLHRGGPVGNID